MRSRSWVGLVCLLLCLAGCQRYSALNMNEKVELEGGSSRTFTVDPINQARSVSVTLKTEGNCAAYFVKGDAKPVVDKVSNGQEPAAGTWFSKVGGTGGSQTFDLSAKESFSLVVVNPGPKKLTVDVDLKAETK